jgi:hypothetical protein
MTGAGKESVARPVARVGWNKVLPMFDDNRLVWNGSSKILLSMNHLLGVEMASRKVVVHHNLPVRGQQRQCRE